MRVANARMYSVAPAAADAWQALLRWVIAEARVDMTVIDYPAPQPLPALWQRPDLGCAFICGFPFAQEPAGAHRLLAAPVPAGADYAGRPVYWTHLVARRDGDLRTLDDALGRRLAFTTPDSQSGYQALRTFLAPRAAARDGRLFAAAVGPLVTPRRVVEAVLAGEADAGPVDSYAFDLLAAHAPALTSPLRVIARTPPTPIPPLVGAAALPAADADALTQALLRVGTAPDLAPVRAALRLAGFARVARDDYAPLRAAAAHADALGYRILH